jgi:hypothetical protein
LQNNKIAKIFDIIDTTLSEQPTKADKVIENIFKYLSKKLVNLLLEQSFINKLTESMSQIDEALMKKYAQFFKEKKYGKEAFYVNSYDENNERIAFKVNPSEWFDISEVSQFLQVEDEEKTFNIVEEQEREREERINRLSNKLTNPYRYIANLNPSDSTVFNIKYIAPLKLKKTGEGYDKRELRITEGTSCKSEPFGRAGLLKMFIDILSVAKEQGINPPFFDTIGSGTLSLKDIIAIIQSIASKRASSSIWNEYVSNDSSKMNILKDKWIYLKGYNMLKGMTREQLQKFANVVIKYLKTAPSTAEVNKQIDRLTIHPKQPDLEDFLMHQKATQDYMLTSNMINEEDKRGGDIKMFAELIDIPYELVDDVISGRVNLDQWNGWYSENANTWKDVPFKVMASVFLPVKEGEYRRADDFCEELKKWLIQNDLYLYVTKQEKEKKPAASTKKK